MADYWLTNAFVVPQFTNKRHKLFVPVVDYFKIFIDVCARLFVFWSIKKKKSSKTGKKENLQFAIWSLTCRLCPFCLYIFKRSTYRSHNSHLLQEKAKIIPFSLVHLLLKKHSKPHSKHSSKNFKFYKMLFSCWAVCCNTHTVLNIHRLAKIGREPVHFACARFFSLLHQNTWILHALQVFTILYIVNACCKCNRLIERESPMIDH